MEKQINHFKHTWAIPLLLSVLILCGLLSALLGTGIWRVLAWITLSVPIIIIGLFIIKPFKKNKLTG